MKMKWDKFRDPVGVSIDAKRFDQHVSEELLRYEHGFYNGVFGSQTLRRLLKMQLKNRACVYLPDGKIEYSVKGRRASGDMNTGLGNCILMCSMFYTWAKSVDLDCAFINNGDDGLVILERDDLWKMDSLHPSFVEWGFYIELETPVCDFELLNFCQAQPVFDGQVWRMCREPTLAIAKDVTTVRKFNTEKEWNKLRGAVSDGGLALAGGLPIFHSFYEMLGRSARRGKLSDCVGKSGFEYLGEGMSNKHKEVSQEARFSFWKAFGILPDAQVAWEKYYSERTLKYSDMCSGVFPEHNTMVSGSVDSSPY